MTTLVEARPFRSRLGIPIAAILALAAFALLYDAAPDWYFRLLNLWGLSPFRFPFLDTQAVLAAIECHGLGYDVYVADPCDVLTRLHVYSPLFLEASPLGVKAAWTMPAGFVLALLFIAALALLPPPATRRDVVLIGLATFSTMTAYAIERGNNDILIFVLAVWIAFLLRARGAKGFAAYPIILFAAFLKYYPAALLLLSLREKPRIFLSINLAAIAAGGVFIFHYAAQLRSAFALVPSGSYYTDFFGAVNLPYGMAHLLSPLAERSAWAREALPYLPPLLFVLLVLNLLRQALAILQRPSLAHDLDALPAREAALLLIGSILISGCFFAGQNIGYRGIFFLLLLPGLLALSRNQDGRPFARAGAMIVFLMWGECFRCGLEHIGRDAVTLASLAGLAKLLLWLVRELIWWRVVGVLTGLILHQILTSGVARVAFGGVGLQRGTAP